MPGNYNHTSRATGTVLTDAIYNGDHENHVNNSTPDGIDDASVDVSAFRAVSDPGETGTENLPTSLRGEIQRIRKMIAEVVGKAQWYESPAESVESLHNRFEGSIEAVVPVGSVWMFAGADAPVGWSLCDGAALDREAEADLFAVIGTTFGNGDGSTTFNKPDWSGRSPMGAGRGDTAEGGGNGTLYAIGDKVGAETHTLVTGELPAHNHSASIEGAHNHSYEGSFNATGGEISVEQLGAISFVERNTSTDGAHTHTIGDTGGDAAHNNVGPRLATNFIIKL